MHSAEACLASRLDPRGGVHQPPGSSPWGLLLVELPPALYDERVRGNIRQGLRFKTPFPARKLLYVAAGADFYARLLVRAAFGVQPTRERLALVSESSLGHVGSDGDGVRAAGAPEGTGSV